MKLKLLFMGCMLSFMAYMLTACNDSLEVRQAYDFSLVSWYLQEGIEQDETVEIRLTLNRDGNYREAAYKVGYIQLEGDGEVFDSGGNRLVDREMTDLSCIPDLDTTDVCRQVFTLYYKNTGKENPKIRFVISDNFKAERTLDIPFSIKNDTETGQ
ncbi:TraQ conjugal transfer family protein [Phocaeicola vulgatus]|uniref:TraQ conjugal transfer family protein n=1 Tax=Phocaeicola vulgatus TaxID=821 RepID=UPI00189DEEB3|nr:TraQ conjugal transfer family protein [Phocaeicola vulgatus]MDB1018550.1 TraQ conjugal transfer family protein [Phocaeicola vulgatus]